MDEFRRNFGVTDIQHHFEDNVLIKLRRWYLLYLTRSILGLCIHVARILHFMPPFCWHKKRQTSRICTRLSTVSIFGTGHFLWFAKKARGQKKARERKEKKTRKRLGLGLRERDRGEGQRERGTERERDRECGTERREGER